MKHWLGVIACLFSGHPDPVEFDADSKCPRCKARLFTNYFTAMQAEAVHKNRVEMDAELARLEAGWARERKAPR